MSDNMTINMSSIPSAVPPAGEDVERFQKLEQLITSLRPIFQGEGGDARALSVQDGVARIFVEGACEGCSSWFEPMEGGLRLMIQERVPGLKEVIFE